MFKRGGMPDLPTNTPSEESYSGENELKELGVQLTISPILTGQGTISVSITNGTGLNIAKSVLVYLQTRSGPEIVGGFGVPKLKLSEVVQEGDFTSNLVTATRAGSSKNVGANNYMMRKSV